MTHDELNTYIESTLEEIQVLVTSMKGLMVLTEHYANPRETTEYISMLYKCAAKLEVLVKQARNKIDNE